MVPPVKLVALHYKDIFLGLHGISYFSIDISPFIIDPIKSSNNRPCHLLVDFVMLTYFFHTYVDKPVLVYWICHKIFSFVLR